MKVGKTEEENRCNSVEEMSFNAITEIWNVITILDTWKSPGAMKNYNYWYKKTDKNKNTPCCEPY